MSFKFVKILLSRGWNSNRGWKCVWKFVRFVEMFYKFATSDKSHSAVILTDLSQYAWVCLPERADTWAQTREDRRLCRMRILNFATTISLLVFTAIWFAYFLLVCSFNYCSKWKNPTKRYRGGGDIYALKGVRRQIKLMPVSKHLYYGYIWKSLSYYKYSCTTLQWFMSSVNMKMLF